MLTSPSFDENPPTGRINGTQYEMCRLAEGLELYLRLAMRVARWGTRDLVV